MEQQDQHQFMMQRCLDLARRALGYTAPNPLVGCVIVKDGQIVGEGYHPRAGAPHAEVFALKAAGEQARGATLYVNLEPCNHYGRTPPCTEAVIQAGVYRVVVGMIDPDQRVSGRGVARLREAGLEVLVGVAEAECRELNEPFVHRVIYQRPFGILKYAMTLDGKIATSSGHSAWVTAEPARMEVHHLRAICDAVIIGGNTLRRDNPRLTIHRQTSDERPSGLSGPSLEPLATAPDPDQLSGKPATSPERNPLRIVMTRTLELPDNAQLWQTEIAPTLVLTQKGHTSTLVPTLEQQGVELVVLDQLTPATAMAHLYKQGLLSVLWECGGTLAAQAIADGCVQKVWAFIAPKIIGGAKAPSPVGELGLTDMTTALNLERVRWRTVGADCLVEGYLPTKTPPPIT